MSFVRGKDNVGHLVVCADENYGTDASGNAINLATTLGSVPGTNDFKGFIGFYAAEDATGAGTLLNGALVQTGVTTKADMEGINLVQLAYTTAAGTVETILIDRRQLSFNYVQYAAEVVQVTNVACTISAAPADSDEYIVHIINTTEGRQRFPRYTKSVLGSDLAASTTTALIDALAAQINAQPAGDDNFPIATAANTAGTALTLTGKTGQTFKIAVEGELEGDAITYTTPWTPGVGTAAQMAQIESDLQAYLGYHNRVWYSSFRQPTSLLAAGTNYDLMFLKWNNIRPAKDIAGQVAIPDACVIALDNADTAGLVAEVTAVLTVLAPTP